MSSESTAGSFPAVIKQVTVPLGPQAALDLFTAGMDRWWPFESHSVYEGKHLSFRFECRVGGQLVETGPDGQESVWGTVESVSPTRLSSPGIRGGARRRPRQLR